MSLLGIDIGTTQCKAAALSVDGATLASAAREYRLLHPAPGWSEFDARDVWNQVRAVIREVVSATRHDPVTALCFSAMGEAVVPVSRSREILGPSIPSSDPRGAEFAEALRRDFGQEAFYRINPNLLGPQYSLPKILWTREHQPELFRKTELFLLWSDLAGFMLGGEPVCNNSHANRTLLFDLDANDWSDKLLGWAGLDRRRFGRIVPGGSVVGTVADAAAAELGLPKGVALVAGGHDQCPNALGCGCITAGTAVCGIGTYECLCPVFHKPADPLAMLKLKLNIEHHVLPDLYVAFLFNQSGSLIKWFRDTFAVAESAAGGDVYARLNAELPAEPTRLLVLPHFDPPPWPEYIPDTAGGIIGLKSDTSRGEILKAIMEGATFHFVEGIESLRTLGVDTAEFIASGGGARSDAWLQIKADIFGVPFVRLRTSEGGVTGAAMLAGLATGVYRTPADAVAAHVKRDRVFDPDARRHGIYRERAHAYRQLYPALRNVLHDLTTAPAG